MNVNRESVSLRALYYYLISKRSDLYFEYFEEYKQSNVFIQDSEKNVFNKKFNFLLEFARYIDMLIEYDLDFLIDDYEISTIFFMTSFMDIHEYSDAEFWMKNYINMIKEDLKEMNV